jgi:hypothetical protein
MLLNGAIGAIGAIADSSAAALIALQILLFLQKRKKKDLNEISDDECTETDATLSIVGDDDVYINEYGLIDGMRPVDASEDFQDLPRVMPTSRNVSDLSGHTDGLSPGERATGSAVVVLDT